MTLLRYDGLIQKFMTAIDKVAPIKERRVKHNSKFDGEVSKAIKNRDNLCKIN